MLPVLVQLGPLTLYTYTVLVNLGVVLGLVMLYRRAPADLKGSWVNAGLAAFAGGLIGGRFVYVSVHASYYAGAPFEALAIWAGGLSWPGATLGAVVGAWLYTRWRRQPLWPVVDALAVPIAALGALTWAGCWAASCAYGVEVDPTRFPLAVTAPDIYGLEVPRWPTQALGLLWSLAALGVVWAIRERRWRPGSYGLLALSLVALGAFMLALTRGDPMPAVSGARLDVVGSGLVFLLAGAGYLGINRK